MPLEPSCFQIALSHLASHDDLERPLAQREFPEVVAVASHVLAEEAIEVVALPVEFFLQGDHPAPEACRQSSCLFQTGLRGRRSQNDRIRERGVVVLSHSIQQAGEWEWLLIKNGVA